MTNRIGFFAGLADILTAMCVYYVAAVFIMGERWGVHLVWLVLCAAVCAALYAALLKKPRGVPLLTAVTVMLFAAVMAALLLVGRTPLSFGHVFVLAVGGGMAAGVPLYTCLHRPQILRHLTHLDVLIAALLVVLVIRQALGIDGGTVALMVAVLFMDTASAVGLRMSDDGHALESGPAFRASMVALAAAAVLALVIALFTLLFSRSGHVAGSVLQGIAAAFAAMGKVIERFFRWLAALVRREEQYDAAEPEDMPALVNAEYGGGQAAVSLNTTAVGIVLCALVLAAVVLVAVVLRKHVAARGTKTAGNTSDTEVRRIGGTAGRFWARLRAALRFRWTAFRNRNTPGGLLVRLERLGRRARVPRRTGESMREFITRMDGSGGLDELSDALDREYYGGGAAALDADRCREMRRHMRNLGKAVRHG